MKSPKPTLVDQGIVASKERRDRREEGKNSNKEWQEEGTKFLESLPQETELLEMTI